MEFFESIVEVGQNALDRSSALLCCILLINMIICNLDVNVATGISIMVEGTHSAANSRSNLAQKLGLTLVSQIRFIPDYTRCKPGLKARLKTGLNPVFKPDLDLVQTGCEPKFCS